MERLRHEEANDTLRSQSLDHNNHNPEITTIKVILLGVGQSVSQGSEFPLHMKFGFVTIFLRF